MGPGLTRTLFFGKKSFQNSSKPVLIFWSSIPCMLSVYTLLKVVSYYDLSVLDGGGWVVELYPSVFWIFF